MSEYTFKNIDIKRLRTDIKNDKFGKGETKAKIVLLETKDEKTFFDTFDLFIGEEKLLPYLTSKKPLTNAEYIKAKGPICPFCKHDQIEGIKQKSTEGMRPK